MMTRLTATHQTQTSAFAVSPESGAHAVHPERETQRRRGGREVMMRGSLTATHETQTSAFVVYFTLEESGVHACTASVT